MQSTSLSNPFQVRRPVLAFWLLAAVDLAACRKQEPEAERIAIAQWQSMVASARDLGALSSLRERARAGLLDAQRALGISLSGQSQADLRAEGLAWLATAAERGSAEARFVLGKLEWSGTGVPLDYSRALANLTLAAAKGEPRAHYYLALMARNGHGMPVNRVEAAKHLEEAAKSGIPAAMFLLANAYREGEGVSKDEKKALSLYEAAAEKDHPESIQALAMAYRNGELGLQPDPARYENMLAELAHAHRHAPQPP
jgi:TPR repeat protein